VQRRFEATVERLRGATSIRRAQANVARHYELPEEFYRFFLDDDLQYSSAHFRTEEDSLELAQRNKKEHLAAKLLLAPGLDVLDIGSGWGGLALYLASHFDVHVLGITLSRQQLDVSRRRARETGLSDRVRFELCDYREVKGTFDRIVSVGMFEHVGAAAYDTFFERVAALLRQNGIAVLNSIGRMEPPCTQDSWMRTYVFPGAHIPALSEALAAVEHSTLWCTDIEVLRLHYARTIRHWRSRFARNRDEVQRLFGERCCREWELYLAGAEVSFRRMRQMVFQMQLARSIDAVPLTRDYVFERERLASRELERAIEPKESEDDEGLGRDTDEAHFTSERPNPLV
jgi:cyclopropane-fatty-acyl-phospholipid synthase